MVEHTAVNRGVVGSSPTRGVKLERVRNRIWLLGQAVKTSPFHGGNTGSIPVGVIRKLITKRSRIFLTNKGYFVTINFVSDEYIDSHLHRI